MQTPTNDIVNSKDWSEAKWLDYFQDRLNFMRSKKSTITKEFDKYEKQTTAISYYDNQWELNVNVPLEENLIEIYMGRTNGKVDFAIEPDGQADVEALQPTKFAMSFFLDWNGKDNFWKENKQFRQNKAVYWTGVRFTWHRAYKDYRYEIKEDAVINDEADLQNPKNFNKSENETYFFFPQNIHPKDFYIDDWVYGENDVQKADDCIIKERLSWMEFETRYWAKQYNTSMVTEWTDTEPKNLNDTPQDERYVVVMHYYHRITKKYLVVANEETVILNWIYLYNDGKLPVEMVQHYTNNACIRGNWVPRRVWYLKAYKSEVLQDILTGSAMSSWINLLVWGDDEIGQDWDVWGRKVNLWRTTWGAENVQQVNTSPNLWYFTTVLNLIDDLVVQDTWDNLRAPFQAQSDKVGIVEIMEANKIVRQSSVDENYNIWLDSALTMMLARIKQFAPALLSEKIYWKDWKLLKATFPLIKMDWYEIKKEWGKKIVVEAIGKYWYFELKPDVIQWIGVKIVTSSTNVSLDIIERAKITEFINNIMTMWNVASLDQTWEMMKKLSEFVRFDELIWWMSDTYGYDINWLKANTEKDEIARRNMEKLKVLQEALKINTPTNENPWPNQEMKALWWAMGGNKEIQTEEWNPWDLPPVAWNPTEWIQERMWWAWPQL